MNKSFLALLLLGVMLFACNKRLGGLFGEEILIKETKYAYLAAKAKIKYHNGEKDLSGTAHIRAKRDSAVWISISPGLGVEVARILILKDSVFFLDRINDKYLATNYRELSALFGFDLNYEVIESLIIGNLIFPYRRSDLIKEIDGYSFKYIAKNYIANNFIGRESKKLEKMDIEDIESKNSISVNYSDFKVLEEGEILPHNILARLDYISGNKQSTEINIGYNKVSLPVKSLKFPFSVPSKFSSY